ncbi:extracellular superoxide dismutase [Cu-Zn] isoform X2 [Lissotriton helveticus]
MSGEPREGQDHASSRHTLGGAWLTQIQVDSLKLLNPTGTWTQDQVDSLKLLNSTGTWTEVEYFLLSGASRINIVVKMLLEFLYREFFPISSCG